MRADRHGRLRRSDGDRRRRPVDGFRARHAGRFQDLAEEALSGLPPRLLQEVAKAKLVLEDVPAPGDEEALGDQPALGRLDLARPRRLVLYRRAIELRAGSRMELADVIRDAAAQAIGRALGLPEEDWDWEGGEG